MKQKGLVLTCPERSRGSKAEGFTLFELVLALAVGSVLLTGAVLAIQQVFLGTDRSNNQVVALTDINQAALVIKNDLLMAQTTDFVDGVSKSSANLTWIDYTSSFGSTEWTSHSSAYTLSGRELRRTYDGVESIVGRNVASVNFTQSTELTQSGKRVTVAVTIAASNSTLSSGIETLQFSIHLRPEEIQ